MTNPSQPPFLVDVHGFSHSNLHFCMESMAKTVGPPLAEDCLSPALAGWSCCSCPQLKKGSGTGHSEIWKGLLMSHPYMFSQSCLVLPEFLDPTLGDLGNGHG